VDNTAFLLTDPSPLFRNRVLRELLNKPADDGEVRENILLSREDPLFTELLCMQREDGSWSRISPLNTTDFSPLTATGQALRLLALLGYDSRFEPAARAVEYLFSQQLEDGSWPLGNPRDPLEQNSYSSVSLQTSLPLQGLAALGLSRNRHCEKAYSWLLDQRIDDGSWPTGRVNKVLGFVAGYRRLAHSRWGCRSNTSSAVLCLSLHPDLSNSDEARRGLDHLLGRETREKKFLGFDLLRLLGRKPLKGFFTFYAQNDLLLMLQLCACLGAGTDDDRVADLVEYFENLKNPLGLWNSPEGIENNWFSFQIIKAINRISDNNGWQPSLPRTAFTPYPKADRRY
jgi:Squalene-hopene cyclase C-terminal domain